MNSFIQDNLQEHLIMEQTNTEICIICIEPLDNTQKQNKLPCNHSFHDSCISKWLNNSPESNCPICRYKIHQVDTLNTITRINFQKQQCFVGTIAVINVAVWIFASFSHWQYVITVFTHILGLFGTISLNICYLHIYLVIWVYQVLFLCYQLLLLYHTTNFQTILFWVIMINLMVSLYMVLDLLKLIKKIRSYRETIHENINI